MLTSSSGLLIVHNFLWDSVFIQKTEEEQQQLMFLSQHRFSSGGRAVSAGREVSVTAGKQSWTVLVYGRYCCETIQSESPTTSVLLVDAPELPHAHEQRLSTELWKPSYIKHLLWRWLESRFQTININCVFIQKCFIRFLFRNKYICLIKHKIFEKCSDFT